MVKFEDLKVGDIFYAVCKITNQESIHIVEQINSLAGFMRTHIFDASTAEPVWSNPLSGISHSYFSDVHYNNMYEITAIDPNVRTNSPTSKHTCNCQMFTLMTAGCTCGGI